MPTVLQTSPLRLGAVLVLGVLCAGCSAFDDVPISDGYDARSNDRFGRPTRDLSEGDSDRLFGGDLLSFGTGSDEAAGAQLPVNKFLWRGSLETLSVLPLASTDPYGGVIVTDWSAPAEGDGERLKVTVFITSAEFKPQSLRVVVNKQRRDESGTWVAAGVADDTVRQLEDSILTRARQLRQQERDAG